MSLILAQRALSPTGLIRLLAALAILTAFVGLPRAHAAPVAARDGAWHPVAGSASNGSLLGFVDVPTESMAVPAGAPFVVSGWLVDFTSPSGPGIAEIQLFRGQMGAGGSLIGTATLAGIRPDVGAAFRNPVWNSAGWTVPVPAGALSSTGAVDLTLYARTASGEWWMKPFAVAIAAPAPAPAPAPSSTEEDSRPRVPGQPMGEILSPRDGQNYEDRDIVGSQIEVRGWAIDRDATPAQGTGIRQVRLSVDGRGMGFASLGQAHGNGESFGPQFSRAGFEGTINAREIGNGRHTLVVTIVSAVDGSERELTTHFNVRVGCIVVRESEDDSDKPDEELLPHGC